MHAVSKHANKCLSNAQVLDDVVRRLEAAEERQRRKFEAAMHVRCEARLRHRATLPTSFLALAQIYG